MIFHATLGYSTFLSTLLYDFSRYTWLPYVSFYATLRFFTLLLAKLRLFLSYSTPFYATPGNPALISTLTYAFYMTLHITLRVFCYDTFYVLLRWSIRFYLRTFHHSFYVTLNAIFSASLYATFYVNIRCFLCFILRHTRYQSTLPTTLLSMLISYFLRFFLRYSLR
jgi:hypothetical protein